MKKKAKPSRIPAGLRGAPAPSCPECGAEMARTPDEPPRIEWIFANHIEWERIADYYCPFCQAIEGRVWI